MAAHRFRAALTRSLVKHDCTRCGHIERTYASCHWNTQQMVACATNKVVKAGAFTAKHQDAIAGEVELVVVYFAAFIETDHPKIALLELFQRTYQVHNAGHAQVFRRTGACLYSDRAKWRCAALGEENSVYACSVGDAKQSAKILWVFDAIEREEETCGIGFLWIRGKEILECEELLRTNDGHHTLMGSGFGGLRELIARLGTNPDACLPAYSNDAFQPVILALAGYQNVIETAAAGTQRFFNRMEAVEEFHEAIVEDEVTKARNGIACSQP